MRGWLAVGGVLGALALAGGAIPARYGGTQQAQAATAWFSVTPASQTVSESGSSVSVDVMLNEAAGVSSWEFRLAYDPDVLDLASASADQSFLSGLPGQYCPAAVTNEDSGWVQLGCITTGQNAGKSGSGRVATITFAPKDAGKSNLLFTKVDISDAFAESYDVTAGTGVIKVAGPGDSNALEPTPTVNPSLLTPTNPQGQTPDEVDPNDPNVGPETPRPRPPTPPAGVTGSGSGAGGSGSGGTGSVRGATGSAGSGTPGSAAGPGGSASGGAVGPDGAPVAGYGLREEPAVWPRYLLGLTALAGLGLAGAGVAMARRSRAV